MDQLLRSIKIGLVVFITASLLIGIVAIGITILVPIVLIGVVIYFAMKLYNKSPWLQKIRSKRKKGSSRSSYGTYYEVDDNGKTISKHTVTIIEPSNNKRSKR